QGSAGIYRLRQELLARVSQAIYPAKVRNVLFREMLIQ
ncbi:MAG TPA: flagellar basal body protein FliL, partial [Rhodospirillaceae bacterium]|nr:flagellar basal body protein FliL [Rhodospirillaceae bacterium]